MNKTNLLLAVLFALLAGMILNNIRINYDKSVEIELLKSQLDLSEKRLGSEIERKNAQLEDMRNWISDSRTLNITIKEKVVYLNKTYAIMMFEPEQYPDWLGYTRLDYTIHLRNGMTLLDYYKVCTHEKAHNKYAWRNETQAKEAEGKFDKECFYFAEFLFEKIMTLPCFR